MERLTDQVILCDLKFGNFVERRYCTEAEYYEDGLDLTVLF